MNKIKTGLMAIGIILLILPLFANQRSIIDSIAVVSDHSGTALIFSEGKWKPAEINMPIYEGDEFRTKADSSLEITFDDATIIKLGSNTYLKLSHMKRNANIAITLFSLVKGKFLAIVDKLKTPDSRFEVHTKMAIAAVKGTEFVVTADDSETNIGVFEGAVDFKGKKGKVLVKANTETKISGVTPDPPKKLVKMLTFKKEIDKLREEIKIIRELKQKGKNEVIQYRIKKKLQNDGKTRGEAKTQITIGETNENTGKIREKVQNILKAKLKKEFYNEKSHAYRDLKFINEEMKADIHLGKTMTDVHGNRIRMEEFIYRPAANQVNLLSLTLRKGRIDYLKGENIFINAIDDNIAWHEWKRMWQKEWYYTKPTNWLKEQRIVLSNVNDWVFVGTLYSPTLWENGGLRGVSNRWKLLKHTEILAFTKQGAPAEPDGDMTVANFIINPINNQYVREHRLYGDYNLSNNTQSVYRGILDKTYTNSDDCNDTINYWRERLSVSTGYEELDNLKRAYNTIALTSLTQPDLISYQEKNENLFDLNKLAMKHTRYYNDGSNLSLGIVLIDDYGFMQELPKPNASALDKAMWLIDVVLNTNVELIVKSNQFADQKMGIDIVSKMLWWLTLNPQNKDNTTPINEDYTSPEGYIEPVEVKINP